MRIPIPSLNLTDTEVQSFRALIERTTIPESRHRAS
ncbi:hypothetical protein PDIG_23180 [Penicillium digitatum PHI26]|uniref:Uncharacterized protein n=2 Tax=Penicillium digitatum TaxID=36651 RepID=K9GMN4_PEND2|nr:hypothetical protein PDIP_15580 [Penicillium digitatum Pd1]EKV15963.1 hypothetical protein PDIG_23180 [Penicillium digitatum PHI26]EKV20474.1 hypothetical protein PDIP_15580 [Penicillium digitatum Pd1]